MVARRPRVSGLATATVGTAWSSVHSLSRASAILRVVTPMTTTAAASAIAETAAMPSPRRDTTRGPPCGAGSGDMRLSLGLSIGLSDRRPGRLAVVLMHQAEHHRHEYQCGNGGKHQAAHDGSSQRS